MNITLGEGIRDADDVIGHVETVLPNGDAIVKLNERGLRLYGPYIQFVIMPSKPEQADVPHIAKGTT